MGLGMLMVSIQFSSDTKYLRHKSKKCISVIFLKIPYKYTFMEYDLYKSKYYEGYEFFLKY